ncbi:hypothetical protein [Methanohalophilus portucalensis]|uniref:Uncharacterized protein n=1 Tax=Methanohalophilus portucalensis FDF-1 TaxID=523843 RepID=A0A1L9C1L7_9EURY|nr:hypothetical protein [Methanohalophilus portucalensis]OJH48444.1 hypothetical protein MPF_2047 [Methanohalophilus portucalensis FDF-1]RNI08544.1 hypothetical protein EFE41_10245 [Methanohalophilus portucalensis FDF-1]SMH44941.1 hypothetical protein SAMN06264941_2138 [Methanohalophilus portucalensis FDF-1]
MSKIINSVILCLILCSTLLYSGCISNETEEDFVSNQTEEKKVIELTDIDQHIITKVSVRNGLSGDLSTTNDRVKIEKLISQLDRYTLEEKDNQEPMFGYRYSIKFYSGSSKISKIVIVDSKIMEVDEVYYDVINSSFDIATIDKIVGSI